MVKSETKEEISIVDVAPDFENEITIKEEQDVHDERGPDLTVNILDEHFDVACRFLYVPICVATGFLLLSHSTIFPISSIWPGTGYYYLAIYQILNLFI